MAYTQLAEHERYQIYSLMKAKHTQKEIALLLNRHPATISRELRRNRGLRGYRPRQAQQLSQQRRQAAYKYYKVTSEVYDAIVKLLRQELSPQQVVAYLKHTQGLTLHHETIYQIVYADKAAVGNLYTHLRIAPKHHCKRYGHYDRLGKLKNRISIENRPAIVDTCSRIGDWEGDTIMVDLKGKHAQALADKAIKGLQPIKQSFADIDF